MTLSISARAAVSQRSSLHPAEAVTPTHSPPPAALDPATALIHSLLSEPMVMAKKGRNYLQWQPTQPINLNPCELKRQ